MGVQIRSRVEHKFRYCFTVPPVAIPITQHNAKPAFNLDR